MKKLFSLTILGLILSFGSKAQITGPATLCVGSSSYQSDSLIAPGTWTSSNPAVATVVLGPSMYTTVTGISAGTATITCTSGSIVDTRVVTVNPLPAAIVGGSSVCVGSTLALTNATPGGTWSSTYTYVATIGAATGVLTGVHTGTSTVSYTLGSGCAATRVVTVGTTPVDSIVGGPSTVCAGSNITLTNTTSGGVWTSANTAIATVGASTGVVTGVAAGAVNITYTVSGTCGSAFVYKNITVTSGTYAGTLSGASSVGVGSTIALSASVTGGTWTSGSTGVATVSSTGIVSGVSAGTATISYAVSGCSGIAYATKVVTVNPANIISGQVLFGGAPYYGPVKVWLITYNPSTLNLQASDSVYAYASGTSASYQFLGKPTDSFRVKAAVVDSAVTYPYAGYVPTYHTSSNYWSTASVINHVIYTSDINKDINMGYGTVVSGTGFIGGNVTMGANKGTAGSVPSVNLLVYLVNQTTGAIVEYTYTDASGNYSFSNIAVGQTYKIYPELINYATTAYTSINLTAGSPSATAADFVQHTISHTITPKPVSIGNVTNTASYVAAFPNPTSGKVTVEWNIATSEKATVAVMDITGREVFTSSVDMTAGAGSSKIDLSHLTNGLYVISVKSASVNYNSKIQVQK